MATKPTYEELDKIAMDLKKEVDECKSAKKSLKHSEHYFRSILNHIHEDILIIDQDFRITDANKTFLVTAGRKREDVIGHYCYEISHGYDEPCEKKGEECMLRRVFKTGKECVSCHQHLHAEGWKAWVDILISPLKDDNGKVTHVIEAVRDVTDLVKAGKALRESEEKYRRIVESTPDWIWSIDIEGRVTYTNEAVKYLLGYEVQEILGESSFWPMHPEDQKRFQKLFHRKVEQKRGWKNQTVCWFHKDGRIRYLESSAQPILDAEGHLIGFTGMDRDITETERAKKSQRK